MSNIKNTQSCNSTVKIEHIYENEDSENIQVIENNQNCTEYIFDFMDEDHGEWTLFAGEIGSEFHILDDERFDSAEYICLSPSAQFCKNCRVQLFLPQQDENSESQKIDRFCSICSNHGEIKDVADTQQKSEVATQVENYEFQEKNPPTSIASNNKRPRTGDGPYRCDVCTKTFFRKKQMVEHKLSHQKEKPYQCHICMKQMNRKYRLKKHLLTHETSNVSAKVLMCSNCKMAFKSSRDAMSHVHGTNQCFNIFEALDSGYINSDEMSASSDSSLKSHLMDDLEGDRFSDLGEKKFGDILDFSKRTVAVVETDKVYQCEYCTDVYLEKSSLNKHRNEHKGVEKPFKCSMCDSAFTTYSRRASHLILHKMPRHGHKFMEMKYNSVDSQHDQFPVARLFACEECEKTFTDRSYLNKHIKTVHSGNNERFNCNMCEKGFSIRFRLQNHINKVHSVENGSSIKSDERTQLEIIPTEPSYHCSECGETFLHSSGLRNHRRRSHGKRDAKFPCQKCGKCFYGMHDLTKHLRLHSGERPFTCDVCKRAFRTKSTYKEHIQIHTGVKPYACDICGHAFSRSRAMKSHRLNHMKKRQFKCSMCPQLFSFQSDLKAHIQHEHRMNDQQENVIEDYGDNENTVEVETSSQMEFYNDSE